MVSDFITGFYWSFLFLYLMLFIVPQISCDWNYLLYLHSFICRQNDALTFSTNFHRSTKHFSEKRLHKDRIVHLTFQKLLKTPRPDFLCYTLKTQHVVVPSNLPTQWSCIHSPASTISGIPGEQPSQ